MVDNNSNSLFTSFLITVIFYVLPMVIVRMNGPLSKKKAHNFALGNSIIVALIYMIIRFDNGISVGSFSPAILYYFINKSILKFGFKGVESINTKGAGVFTIKENNVDKKSSYRDDFDYKKLYQSYDNDIKKIVFQGGFEDFLSVLQSMKYLLGNEHSYKELIEIYVEVWMGLESNEPNEVVNFIESHYANKHIREKSSIIISFVMHHKKDNGFKAIADELESSTEGFLETKAANGDILNEDYRKLYESLDPKLKPYIFPAGYNEFKIIINSLKYLFGKKYTTVDLTKIYAVNWTRTGQSDADEVVKRIKFSNELKGDEDKIDTLVSFILIHKNNTDFEIKDNESLVITRMFGESFKERVKFKEINNPKITQNIHDVDYGKVSHKPIYIDGFKNTEKFLKSLRSDNGDTVKYERKGSIPGASGSVDIYELENENTHLKEILYVNLYSNNIEYYPPKGYVIYSISDNYVKYESSYEESKSELQNTQPKSKNNEHIEILIQEQNEVKDKTCFKCNHKNPIESKFCSNCGSELLNKMFCKKCGSKIKEGSNFCKICGSKA